MSDDAGTGGGGVFRGVTIDAAASRDLDDAVWVEETDGGWEVTVCVSDVCGGVAAGSAEDLAARDAGFSRYAAAKTLRPMLPRRLSEESLTLAPGRQRRVLGVVVRLSADLERVGIHLGFGDFEHLGRLTHERASDLIEGGEPDLHAMMARAWRLCSRLLDARRSGGALTFFSAGSGLATDEEGRFVDIGVRGPVSRAYIVVQELMILANRALAEHFADAGVPLLYRNHRGSPVADRVALQGDLEIAATGGGSSGAAWGRLGLLLGRAALGPAATGHFGLNLPVYAWFTSPIRRYADLVNQRIVKAVLLGESPPYSPEELGGIARHLNGLAETEAEARSASFKLASERRAEREIGRCGFAALADAPFRAVLKAAFASGAGGPPVPDPLCAEVLARLSSARLDGKDVARVLASEAAGTAPLKAGVIRGLEGQTPLAMAVFNHLGQLDGGVPSWDEASVGPSHGPGFRCRGEVAVGGVVHSGGAVVAGRKDEARQRAAVALLARRFDVDWSPPGAWVQAASTTPTPPLPAPAPAGETPADDNPKGRLQEKCQAKRWPMPVYTAAQTGPSHAPSFEVSVSVATPDAVLVSPKVAARSRKEGERRAAAELLRNFSGPGVSLGEMMDRLPEERRRRVEARTGELIVRRPSHGE